MVRFDDDATLLTALASGQVDIMATSPQIMDAANKRNGKLGEIYKRYNGTEMPAEMLA